MEMRCTATAIDQDKTTYTFVTAAHCGCVDNPSRNVVTAEKTFFFISPDVIGDKIYLKATPKGCGYRTKGDDFLLLTVDKSFKFPVIPLGKDPKLLDEIINVGGPLGMGKQVFLGSVSSPSVDRPITDGDIQWTNAVLLQEFGVNGGSSGSSAVCIDQHAICAFVVGSVAETTTVAMPVSRLLKFREQLAAGKYRWYQADPDAPAARADETAK
jgi:S1-C subfamily serine protease